MEKERAETFTQRVKKELLRVSVKSKEEMECEWAAFFLCGGQPLLGESEIPFYYTTNRQAVMERLSNLLRSGGGQVLSESTGKKEIKNWKIIPLPSENFLFQEILLSYLSEKRQDIVTSSDLLRRAALRGAFLDTGSITAPEKSYRLEFSVRNSEVRRYITLLLHSENIEPQVAKKTVGRGAEKKEVTILYIKNVQFICDFLALTGAHSALLHYESVRIEKGMKNDVNRVVNCDSANARRQADASAFQIQWLEKLLDTPFSSTLPEELLETARMRVENPGLSLREIGELLSPPVSKSGLNHRLKRLAAAAQDMEILENM